MTGSSLARRIALVGLVALVASLVTATAAFAQDPTPDQDTYVDLDADDNPDYSVRWSQFTFESADEVLIGRDDLFPDNLASGSLQGQGGGRPLLLTPSDALDERVANEIGRLGASTAHILGGEFAIGPDVADALEDLGLEVQRHGGETRIETAIEISELVDSDTVIIARAFANEDPTQAFADSLAAGAWAADAGYDLLLTQTEVLTENTQTAIEAAGYSTAFVVGGESAISGETFDAVAALVADTQRVGGANRFETAVLIANERGFASADDAAVTVLTDGQGADAWADGFSAAAFTALHDAPLVLSNSASDSLPAETVAFLEGGGAASFAQDATANELDPDVGLVCGPSVPDGDDPDTVDDQCDEAAALRGLTNRVEFGDPTVVPPNNQSFDVTPTDAITNAIGDERQYTATGIDAEFVDIALVDCDDVTVDEDGNVTFVDDDENGEADLTDVSGTVADISVVNGAATASGDEVAPVDGTVTFTVESLAPGCYVPVVFADLDDDDDLDLDDEATADVDEAEAFGVGGATEVLPDELAEGANAQGCVTGVNLEEDYFLLDTGADNTDPFDRTTCGVPDFLVRYAEGDTFVYPNPIRLITLEQFEAFLTADDFVAVGLYNPGATAQIAYLEDFTNAPTDLDVSVEENDNDDLTNDAEFAWTAATGGDPNTYTVDVFEDDADDETACEDGVAAGSVTTPPDPPETTEAELADLPDGDYCALVFATSETSGGAGDAESDYSDPVEFTVDVEADDTEAPTIENAEITVSGGTANILDNGDTFVLDISEDLDGWTPETGTLRVTDAENGQFDMDCTLVTVACTLGDDGDADANVNDRVTVVLTSDPVYVAGPNATAGAQLPATIIAVTPNTFEDAAGNDLDLAGSADVVIDDELAP